MTNAKRTLTLTITMAEADHIRHALSCIESDAQEHQTILEELQVAEGQFAAALAFRVFRRVRVGKRLTSPLRMADKLRLQGLARTVFYATLHELYEGITIKLDADYRVTAYGSL